MQFNALNATESNSMQLNATESNSMQLNATICNSMQHNATHTFQTELNPRQCNLPDLTQPTQFNKAHAPDQSITTSLDNVK